MASSSKRALAFSSLSFLERGWNSRMARRFSKAVIRRKALGSWGRYPRPSRALLYMGSPPTSWPFRKMRPAVGRIKPTTM
jgi:hypothetical protein